MKRLDFSGFFSKCSMHPCTYAPTAKRASRAGRQCAGCCARCCSLFRPGLGCPSVPGGAMLKPVVLATGSRQRDQKVSSTASGVCLRVS